MAESDELAADYHEAIRQADNIAARAIRARVKELAERTEGLTGVTVEGGEEYNDEGYDHVVYIFPIGVEWEYDDFWYDHIRDATDWGFSDEAWKAALDPGSRSSRTQHSDAYGFSGTITA